jgi:hypothetical protein
MIALAFALAAAAVDASPSMMGMDPAQRDTQCLVALRAEPSLGRLQEEAADYFDERVSGITDPELRELLIISAEEAILPNTNRREIASTCLLLYQVLSLQEKLRLEAGSN